MNVFSGPIVKSFVTFSFSDILKVMYEINYLETEKTKQQQKTHKLHSSFPQADFSGEISYIPMMN